MGFVRAEMWVSGALAVPLPVTRTDLPAAKVLHLTISTGTPDKPVPDTTPQEPPPDTTPPPGYDAPDKPVPDTTPQPEPPADNQPEGGYDAPEKPQPE